MRNVLTLCKIGSQCRRLLMSRLRVYNGQCVYKSVYIFAGGNAQVIDL